METVQLVFATVTPGMEKGSGGRKWPTQIHVEQRVQVYSRREIPWGRKANAKKEQWYSEGIRKSNYSQSLHPGGKHHLCSVSPWRAEEQGLRDDSVIDAEGSQRK
jgi:hypothetical protein